MTLPQRIVEGSEIDLSRIFLRAATGTVSLPALRFFSLTGQQVNGGVGSTQVNLSLDTTWTSLSQLWQSAASAIDPGATWDDLIGRRRGVAVVSDPSPAEVWVSLGDPAPAVPSLKIPSSGRLRVGPVPAEADGGSMVLAGTVSSVLVDLQQAEDAPHVSGHKGIMMLGVRRDSLAALTDAAGDYIPQAFDSFGRALVTAVVTGAAAHGASANTTPVLEALEGRTSDQAAVSNGQVSRLVGSLLGKQVVLPYALPSQSVDGSATLNDTSDTSLVAAGGPGVRTYLTSLVVASDSTSPIIIALKDGATIKIRIPAPAKGGCVIPLPTPLRGSANSAWQAACLSAPGASVFVSAVGYTASE